jgi:tetraacyldisaccharide 4'-kinase
LMSERYFERVLLGEERGAVSWVIRGLAWPFSLVYRAGLAVFLAAYSLGVRKRHRLPVPVVSVGNLTFGGTGKTPAVEAICRILIEQGRKVVVLSRGHGGSARGPLVVSDGKSIAASAAECGDEPLALARALPDVAVLVGRDRRESGDLACRELAPDVIVLDDGLQYWQLERDLDIVVVDAKRPFGSGFVMPMGDLREPVAGLRRAGVILLNSAGELGEEAGRALFETVSRLAPNALILRCARRPSRLAGPDGQPAELDWLRGRRVVGFCGIGRPESFFGTLGSLGADVCERLPYADHHGYTQADLALIESRRESLGAEAVVTTEKDSARLDTGMLRELYVLGIELEIDERSRLAELLARAVDGARQAAAAP